VHGRTDWIEVRDAVLAPSDQPLPPVELVGMMNRSAQRGGAMMAWEAAAGRSLHLE